MKKISYDVKLPLIDKNLTREEEYFMLIQNRQEQKIRIRDYSQVYNIPGLYEYVLVEQLKFNTHNVLSELLISEVNKSQSSADQLSVFELAAGVGLVGQCLQEQGVNSIVGIDLLEEAAAAAKRDRPNVYHRYYVEELPHVTEQVHQELENFKFNCLVCSSALTGGLPGSAFAFAYNLIADEGWIAFNIREDLLDSNQTNHSGGQMLANMIKEGILSIKVKQHYQHRMSVTGNPLNEVALVGLKMTNIPTAMIGN